MAEIPTQDVSMLTTKPIAMTIVEMSQQELMEKETIIERGKQTFVEVGLALMEIRDRRGYRFKC